MTALIFDCDGVLADTERDGHRVAFNAMFAEFGVPFSWSEETYGQALEIAGGKERMRSLLTDAFSQEAGLPFDDDERSALIADWHRRKTELYAEMVAEGRLPARSGVARIASDAAEAGWSLAVASTSSERSVRAVLAHVMDSGTGSQFCVLAGDVVAKKKPAPDIYQLALQRLEVDAEETIVIEDSRNGLLAADGADLACLVTVSSYTTDEDFSEASLVVSSLGEPGGDETEVLATHGVLPSQPYVTLDDLAACIVQGKEERSDGRKEHG